MRAGLTSLGMSDDGMLAVIGGGNMGAALVGGIVESGVVAADQIVIVEQSSARRQQLADLLPDVDAVAELPPIGAAVLAVKPAGTPAVARAAVDAGATRLLSIAAGVTLAALTAAVGDRDDVAVIRAMPNTPALVGLGCAAIVGSDGASDADLDWAESLLGAVGIVERLSEPQLDLFTGLAGSGPAYVFLVAEALVDAAVAEGLPRPTATRVVEQLLLGSSTLLAREGDAVGRRHQVTSPGGTTAAGVARLEASGLRAAFADAVRAATQRSRELG